MENENIKRVDLTEETVNGVTEETANEESVTEELKAEETANEEAVTEETAVEEITETCEEISDEAVETEDTVDDLAETDATEEAVEELDEEAVEEVDEKAPAESNDIKKKRTKKSIIIATVIAAVLAIAAFFVCYTEGVGGNTIVNKPFTAVQTSEQGFLDKLDNIKFENPVVSAFDSITGRNKGSVMKVNGVSIDKNVLSFFTNSTGLNCVYSLLQGGVITDISDFNWETVDETTGLSYKEISKGMAVDSIVPVYATIAEGEKRGIKLAKEDEKSIRDWIDEQKENYGDEFEKILKKSGYADEETLYEIQRVQVYMQKVYEDISTNPDSYITPDMKAGISDDKVTVKHILVQAEGEEEKAAAKKEAEEVLAKAKAGEDFDKLIEEYNDDPGVSANPEGYTFANDGSMVQEFADASFALEIGEISGIVETSYGYHIIKRVERVISTDDYITNLGKLAPVKIKKGVYDKIEITVDLNDYFGAPAEAQPEENEGSNTEVKAE